MSAYSQTPSGKKKHGLQQDTSPETFERSEHEIQHELQDALRSGLTVIDIIRSFKMTEWVVGLQAADIDGDGDTEIVIASRDGWIKAFTRFGTLKWDRLLDGHHISALAVMPQWKDGQTELPRVFVGLRGGKVIALDKEGRPISCWEYSTGRIVRQIYVSPSHPENVLVGSEDRHLHVLDSATGQLRWKYHTTGWVRCVFACDVDGDGEEEILCGSGNKHLYIFDTQGKLLYDFDTGYQVYALYAAPLEASGPVSILMSSDRKDLLAWLVTRTATGTWAHRKVWQLPSKAEERLFERCIHSICVQDINQDEVPEILVGSEDGHLVILDPQGQTLWKQNLRSCIYRIAADDINHDGNIEVLVGTEGRNTYVLQLDLPQNLFATIQRLYSELARFYSFHSIAANLTARESTLLEDIFVEEPSSHPQRMELEEAKRLVQEQQYEQALPILLRLLRQKVQHCWSEPFTSQGYIWTACFSKLADSSSDELVIGTDQGNIYALDTSREVGVSIWEPPFVDRTASRARMVSPGPMIQSPFASILAVLGKHRIVLLDYQGKLIKDHTLNEDKKEWIRSAYYSPDDTGTSGEIILGREDNNISFWDSSLNSETGHIDVTQGVETVYAYDLLKNGTIQIISGMLKNGVYVHSREGKEIWHFETQDRVQALFVADIDKDGYAEVIAGSEDRNIYVLDYAGHIKWRYRTMRGVMDIDVCDIKLEKDPEDIQKRTLKILMSGADGYLYMLNADGDLVWKYQCPNRVRLARARDMNHDGKYEIAIAYENQLELLQILDRNELVRLIDSCWEHLVDNEMDHKKLRQLAEHQDEYIRGSALARLAGSDGLEAEDFRCIQKPLKEKGDISLEVRRELVRAMVNLSRAEKDREEHVHQAKQLLERLYRDPEAEIRLEVVQVLPLLDAELFFEYLERSTDHADIWVRRAVVRRLDSLIERYPRQVFPLLLKTARDEDEWVRQETGRVFAHYFDAHVEQLVADLFTLLGQGSDPLLIQQIAYSVKRPALRGFFQNLVRQMTQLSLIHIAEILEEAIYCIGKVNELGPFYGEELLQVYEEFHQLLSAKTIAAIAGYQRVTRSDILHNTPPLANANQLVATIDRLERVARTIAMYERRQTVGERVSTLLTAQDLLEEARSDFRWLNWATNMPGQPGTIHSPGDHILTLLIEQWSSVIKAELARMHGSANLVVKLENTVVPRAEEVIVSFHVKNDGQCAADNVQINLEESEDFGIIGKGQYRFAQISTAFPESVDFVLHLYGNSARLAFHLVFDDAEKRGKDLHFAEEIVVRDRQRPYHFIANPYTTGTPIRDKAMFYGRKKDLQILSASLGSTSANRVVLLWGQRRMGKTSLIYQLVKKLAIGRYAPVFIDLQALSLKDDMSHILEGFAQCIYREIFHYKNIHVPEPVHEKFRVDASAAFEEYLSDALKQLPEHRLVLLIDEFDAIRRYTDRDGEQILHYLRNLMQHYPGLNFLLSGAPQMPYMEGYHAVLFNIAQEHHLKKLEREDASDLIREPVRDDLEYDSLALEKMLSLTNGWPYFIHVMSEKLIAYCNSIRKSYVTVSEINAALKLVLDEQASSMRWIWQDLSTPTEKLVLSLLAQEKGEEGHVFSLNDIQREFDAYGAPFVHRDVVEALRKLSRGDFVEEHFNGTQYRIPVGLIKAWLRKDEPPERVVREEKFLDDEVDS
jgi:outer membrane protein assembly factor BamB